MALILTFTGGPNRYSSVMAIPFSLLFSAVWSYARVRNPKHSEARSQLWTAQYRPHRSIAPGLDDKRSNLGLALGLPASRRSGCLSRACDRHGSQSLPSRGAASRSVARMPWPRRHRERVCPGDSTRRRSSAGTCRPRTTGRSGAPSPPARGEPPAHRWRHPVQRCTRTPGRRDAMPCPAHTGFIVASPVTDP